MSTIVNMARDLIACMAPMTGTRASGTATVTTVEGEDVRFDKAVYLTPVVSGKARPDLVCKVTANPDEEDGHWDTDSDGVSIGIVSNIGGARFNFPAGTRFLIDPDDPDVSKVVSIVADAQFTGGIDSTRFGDLKDIVIFETMQGNISTAIARSAVKAFPAAIITWMDTDPSDATTLSTSRGSRTDGATVMYTEMFKISIIGQRSDSDASRRMEAMAVLEEASALIQDRSMVDGSVFSVPGIQIRKRGRESLPTQFYQQFYVYNLTACLQRTIERREHRSYGDWNTSVIDGLAMQRPALEGQGDLLVVDDVTVEMNNE